MSAVAVHKFRPALRGQIGLIGPNVQLLVVRATQTVRGNVFTAMIAKVINTNKKHAKELNVLIGVNG